MLGITMMDQMNADIAEQAEAKPAPPDRSTDSPRQSLRLRILIVTVLVALLPVAVLGALIWSDVEAMQQLAEEQVLRDLHPVAIQAVALANLRPDLRHSAVLQRGGALALDLDQQGRPLGQPRATPLGLHPGPRPGSVHFHWHSTRWIGWRETAADGHTLLVARPTPLSLYYWPEQLPLIIEVLLLVMLLITGAGLYLGEAYARPLDLLTRKLRALSRGDFSPVVVPQTRIYEFHHMAGTVGDMAGHLQQKFSEVGQLNETLRIRFDEVQRHVDLLKSLGEVNQSLIAPTNLAMLLDAAFPKILEVCHLEVGCLFIRQGTEDDLHLQIAEGFGVGAITVLQSVQTTDQLPGLAARYRQVLVTENLPADDRPSVSLYREDGLEAIIHIPLLANGALIGVLALGSRQPGHFTAHEVSTLITVANQLAIAIQNVQLYQQTARTKSQLEAIINALSDGLVVVDTERRIILANRWADNLLGSDVPLQGSRLLDLIGRISPNLEEPDEFRQFAERLFTQPDRTQRAEIALMSPVRRFIHLKGTPIPGADDVAGWVILLQDTTQDREAQLALESARSRLEAIFHSLPHPVFVIDDLERIVAANPAFDQLYDLRPPLRLTHFLATTARLHRNSAEIDLSLRQALRRPTSQPLEIEISEPEHRIYQVITQPLTSAGGTYAGALAVYHDITAERETARWQAEFIGRLEALVAERTRTLKEKDRRLSSLYTVQDVFRTAHSRADLLALIPRELCRTLEYDRAVLYLQESGELRCAAAWSKHGPVTGAMAGTSEQHDDRILQRCLRDGQAFFTDAGHGDNVIERLGARRYGVVPIKPRDEILGVLLVDRSGTVGLEPELELVSVFANLAGFAMLNVVMVQALEDHNQELERTVRQLQDAYDDLQGAQSQLIRAEKMAVIGQVAAGVAHEIKNRFNVINMAGYYLKMKLGDTLDGPLLKTLKRMEQEIDRGSRMITDLLQMAKPSDLNVEPLDISSVMDEALTVVAKPTVRVERHIGADVPPVLGDRSHLQQVFLNLFLNAAQAMPNGGQLTLRAWPEGADVLIDVADTGVGIPPAHLDQLFNPFFTTKRDGTGLGLGITQVILEQHQGSITVRSVVGEGTVFTVRLPQAPPGSVPAATHEPTGADVVTVGDA
jgi:signal transduction histidine kinase/PAS domain-containing protein